MKTRIEVGAGPELEHDGSRSKCVTFRYAIPFGSTFMKFDAKGVTFVIPLTPKRVFIVSTRAGFRSNA